MGIDIRFPIGMMFAILGLILTCYGFFTRTDPALYKPSLGININLWSGAGMLLFGLFMLAIAFRRRKTGSKRK